MNTKECNKKVKLMFPEHREIIPQLRQDNPRFAKIFEEHAELDQEIYQRELNPVFRINDDIEALKRKKLRLKDEIYRLLQYHVNSQA
ncbi:YdcH family protein [Acinetobacter sp. ANC 4173]|jgi:uncharacterized protein YdcH (DUF465 family)|uniref:YdcH family protein n=1 Tax=Acinetobacter sp. ANC 4173 TaxID=2529837 RepID=UPI00103BA610|nr:YdcH family protein [Acinetobacter sp. ANC 4173]TCB82187.1 DUF465 domain-containing protein [Acinetobacter sp. ANC 4173]